MFKQVNNKYKDFTAAGHLMELGVFVSLPVAVRDRIRELALSLVKDIKTAEEKLTHFKLKAEPPITQVDKKEVEFFESDVLPNLFKIDSLASNDPEKVLEIEKLLSGIELFEINANSKSIDIYKYTLLMTINELLCHEPEGDEDYILPISLYPDDLDFEGLKSIRLCVQSKYFDPQGWMERGKQARLLFSNQDASKYPIRIKGRVAEAYNAYVSGYSFACIATCRSLLEYVLVDRAKSNTKWKFDPYYVNNKGEREIKSLYDLCDNFSNVSPNLDLKLNCIRLHGNRVLHASANSKKEEFPPQRKTAETCLRYVFEVIEELYC